MNFTMISLIFAMIFMQTSEAAKVNFGHAAPLPAATASIFKSPVDLARLFAVSANADRITGGLFHKIDAALTLGFTDAQAKSEFGMTDDDIKKFTEPGNKEKISTPAALLNLAKFISKDQKKPDDDKKLTYAILKPFFKDFDMYTPVVKLFLIFSKSSKKSETVDKFKEESWVKQLVAVLPNRARLTGEFYHKIGERLEKTAPFFDVPTAVDSNKDVITKPGAHGKLAEAIADDQKAGDAKKMDAAFIEANFKNFDALQEKGPKGSSAGKVEAAAAAFATAFLLLN